VGDTKKMKMCKNTNNFVMQENCNNEGIYHESQARVVVFSKLMSKEEIEEMNIQGRNYKK